MANGWKTGGRQKGTPNKATADIKSLARVHGPAVIAELARLSGVTDAPGAQTEAARIAAMRELLDRGYGRATSVLAGDAENPIGFVIRGPAPVSSTEEWLRLHAPPDAAGQHVVIDAEAEPVAPEPSAPAPAASVPARATSSVFTAAEWLAAFNRSGRD